MKTKFVFEVKTEAGDNSPFCTAFCYMAGGPEFLLQGRWISVRAIIKQRFGACLVHFLLKRSTAGLPQSVSGITKNQSTWEFFGRNLSVVKTKRDCKFHGLDINKGRFNIIHRRPGPRLYTETFHLIASFRNIPKKWLPIYDSLESANPPKVAEPVSEKIPNLSLVRPIYGSKTEPTAHEIKIRNIAPFVFMGEIPNMPRHGVFVSVKTGEVLSCLHIDDFEKIPDDET